jgi:two-component system alkaline phosphatase synthesis response regulator PhoP
MKEKKIKILLVDDEQDILEIVGYNLSQEGYQIVTASNGKEAIAKAKKELPQLIIMDVMMPEMDGMEACENIRKIPELQDTIITFLTARSEDYSQIAGFDAGADDYLVKPFGMAELLARVRALQRRLPNFQPPQLQIGSLMLDYSNFSVVNLGLEPSLPIILTAKEFQLLEYFMQHPQQILTHLIQGLIGLLQQ